MRRRVGVTGMGMITPLGTTLASTWAGLVAGRSAVRPIRRFDSRGFPVTFAAEVPLAWAGDEASLKLELARIALEEALAMAGPLTVRPERLGVCMGSEAARPALDEVARRLRTGEPPTIEELAHGAPDAPTRLVVRRTGARGPASTVSTACTSSSQAVGEAMLRIRRGEVDAMIAGGVDVLVNPVMVTGFALLGALSTRNEAPERASRPFDLDRDGFVLGEGAGFLVLEAEEVARARGAETLVELSGWGCSCNAWRITDSPPDGRGAAQSMSAALADAGLTPADIGYVNAHGTSTPQNDASETVGIQRALGDQAASTPVSSTKSMMGHLVAACGAVEAIVAAMAVREGVLPPTVNLDHPDPACALNHVANTAWERRIDHALTNAFGFGGSNGSILVSRWA